MTNIIDRRFTIKDSSVENRKKFLDRYKNKIKDAVKKAIDKQSIKDFKFKDQKVKITVDDNSLDLPSFEFDPEDGVYSDISVGNKKYKKGDKVKKPQGRGNGNNGSPNGGGEDSFEFTLTEEEFAKLFFEDLELPELIKKQFTGEAYEIQKLGFSTSGSPSSLSIRQTIIRAFIRRFALNKQKKENKNQCDGCQAKHPLVNGYHQAPYPSGIMICQKEKYKVNFLEDIDLRYNYRDKVELPSTKAVMFALMDVSGSMGEKEKDIAKRFFILLNMFLKRNYKTVDVVFVRHAEWAEECTEDVFFHDRASGGTIISAGYEKILDILNSRYDRNEWNIYISQATDGDNWENDSCVFENTLDKLLNICQYFAYIEIPQSESGSRTYKLLTKIGEMHKNLATRLIREYNEIFEVFRGLFTKEKK